MRKLFRMLLSAAALTAASALCITPLAAFAAEPEDMWEADAWDTADLFPEEPETSLQGREFSALSLEELQALPLDSPLWDLDEPVPDTLEQPDADAAPVVTEPAPDETPESAAPETDPGGSTPDETEPPAPETPEEPEEASGPEDPAEEVPDADAGIALLPLGDEEDPAFLPVTDPDDLFLAEEADAAPVTVDIQWMELHFTYTPGEWDTEQLCYGSGCWTEDQGCFTVTNTSTTAITLSCTFTSLNGSISGNFAVHDAVSSYTQADGSLTGYPLAVNQTATVTLRLSGDPADAWENVGTIGTLSVAVAADPSAVSADEPDPPAESEEQDAEDEFSADVQEEKLQ